MIARYATGKDRPVTYENETLKVVALENGSTAVVKIDPKNPRLLEVVATFFDADRAEHYVKLVTDAAPAQVSTNGNAHAEPVAAPSQKVTKPVAPVAAKNTAPKNTAPVNGISLELSARQSAVLNALREKMDENQQVEAKAAALAEAARIPLGSLHSVLGSLEKKQLIQNTRPGTPRAPAVYQVL